MSDKVNDALESKALAYARDINLRRFTLKDSLTAAIAELSSEVKKVVGALKTIDYYKNVAVTEPMGPGTTPIEVSTPRMFVAIVRTKDGISAKMSYRSGGDYPLPAPTYSLFYGEWRQTEDGRGLTTAEVADAVLLDLLNSDEDTQRANEANDKHRLTGR